MPTGDVYQSRLPEAHHSSSIPPRWWMLRFRWRILRPCPAIGRPHRGSSRDGITDFRPNNSLRPTRGRGGGVGTMSRSWPQPFITFQITRQIIVEFLSNQFVEPWSMRQAVVPFRLEWLFSLFISKDSQSLDIICLFTFLWGIELFESILQSGKTHVRWFTRLLSGNWESLFSLPTYRSGL